jgi:hypothetical protein
MTALRRLGRRLLGRDSLYLDRKRPPAAAAAGLEQVKARRAEHAVREAKLAVDAFTRSLDDAMRGQRS